MAMLPDWIGGNSAKRAREIFEEAQRIEREVRQQRAMREEEAERQRLKDELQRALYPQMHYDHEKMRYVRGIPPPPKPPGELSDDQVNDIVKQAMASAGLEKPDPRVVAHQAIERDAGVYCRPSVLAFAIQLENHMRENAGEANNPLAMASLYATGADNDRDIGNLEGCKKLLFAAARELHDAMKKLGFMQGTRAIIDEDKAVEEKS